MWYSYIKIALRNIWRNKLYSGITIFSLAFGLTCCMMIGLYVYHELSFDRFHANADRTFRIQTESEGFGISTSSSPALFGQLDQFSEVESATRVFRHWFQPLISRNKEKGFVEEQFFFADSSIFDVFTVDLVRGEGRNALTIPFQLLITESTAARYFGRENPIGQILKYNAEREFKVAGVIRDFPSESHFRPDFIASMTTCPEIFWPNFLSSMGNLVKTYVVIRPGTAPETLSDHLTGIYRKRQSKTTTSLMPLTDIHLRSMVPGDFSANNDIRYIRLLAFLGFILILISVVNYMNLTVARGITRAKEIAVRQVMGVSRLRLITQFMTESVLISVIAFIGSMIGLELLLPLARALTGESLSLDDLPKALLLCGLLAASVMIGILGGLYPGFVLSRSQALMTLKGKGGRVHGARMQSALVVLQFSAGVVLLIALQIIVHQMRFVQESRLGYTPDQVVIVPLKDPRAVQQLRSLRDEWRRISGVGAVALANAMPGKAHAGDYAVMSGRSEALAVSVNWTDEGFVPALELGMAAGRNFSPEHPADGNGSVLVNEEAARQLGFQNTSEAVGKTIQLKGSDEGRERQIVGVVNDFHFETLHHKIEPLVIVPQFERCAYLLVRVHSANVHGTLDALRDVWTGIASDQPFSYIFMDENFQRLYLEDQRWTLVIGTGAAAALVIACLGLFGLAMFTMLRRTKEIGIRKVLGASDTHIVTVLTRNYVGLIAIANVLAWPLAYFWMRDWLDQFAYRTAIPPEVFPIAFLWTIAIAITTIGIQAFRAATADPVKALQYE